MLIYVGTVVQSINYKPPDSLILKKGGLLINTQTNRLNGGNCGSVFTAGQNNSPLFFFF
jgi:hypothetical protein